MNTIFKILLGSLLCTILIILFIAGYKSIPTRVDDKRIDLLLSQNKQDFHELLSFHSQILLIDAIPQIVWENSCLSPLNQTLTICFMPIVAISPLIDHSLTYMSDSSSSSITIVRVSFIM